VQQRPEQARRQNQQPDDDQCSRHRFRSARNTSEIWGRLCLTQLCAGESVVSSRPQIG
jgi:hypothetical protein